MLVAGENFPPGKSNHHSWNFYREFDQKWSACRYFSAGFAY